MVDCHGFALALDLKEKASVVHSPGVRLAKLVEQDSVPELVADRLLREADLGQADDEVVHQTYGLTDVGKDKVLPFLGLFSKGRA